MLEVATLSDGGQSAEAVAASVAAWLRPVRRKLDLALYSVRVPGPPGSEMASALRDAAARGIAVRAVVHHPDIQPHVLHGAPAPLTRLELLQRLGVQVRTVAPVRDLMHHKFAVRDGEAVWTGSTNWTTDDFTREENAIVRVHSEDVAAAFSRVFDELWESGELTDSGARDAEAVRVGAATVRPWFCPGRGQQLSERIAERIAGARRRVRVASPVITAGPVLEALHDVRRAGTLDAGGVVDRTQTQGVMRQWLALESGWKAPVLQDVLEGLAFSGKPSTPYDGRADSARDYMHAKIVVVDDAVFTGSFNLSRSGEDNAENTLEIEDARLADQLAGYIDGLRARYPVEGAWA